MPKLVSEIQSSLEKYVHPDLEFMDVLNEVLPQLASRGIWKDLTFEESIVLPDSSTRFFTLPPESDALLHVLVGNAPTPVHPLWNAFVNEGAATARMGDPYGVEDAGYTTTKEILSNEFNYGLFLFPDRRGWDLDEPIASPHTVGSFTGNEVLIVEYENWEGVTVVVEFSPRIQDVAQGVCHGVRNIRSIRYMNFTVPGKLVALPIDAYAEIVYEANPTPAINGQELDASLTSNFTQFSSSARMYPMDPDVSMIDPLDEGAISITPSSDTVFTGAPLGTWIGTNPTAETPAALYAGTSNPAMVYERLPDAKAVATGLLGSGLLRYHAFRIQASGTNVHALLRRAIPEYDAKDQIVYIDNLSALKYAFLANTAEFNNDVTQADAWWARAERELNNDLSRFLGAATPQPQLDPSGGQGSVCSIQ